MNFKGFCFSKYKVFPISDPEEPRDSAAGTSPQTLQNTQSSLQEQEHSSPWQDIRSEFCDCLTFLGKNKHYEWAWPIFEGSNMVFGQKNFSSLFETTYKSIFASLRIQTIFASTSLFKMASMIMHKIDLNVVPNSNEKVL
jgi:hypothetical protein